MRVPAQLWLAVLQVLGNPISSWYYLFLTMKSLHLNPAVIKCQLASETHVPRSSSFEATSKRLTAGLECCYFAVQVILG